eukprot:TRINITY_DN80778_c0_g1_i1.p1 TRINITY_DN80778_c0_g1~~TRINITY_DN80778_c0_g1_i1.p1  ORF type:complete len:574 (+),score=28.61 TRINITY_DN80778_c0_g1_i1:86-1807(+)
MQRRLLHRFLAKTAAAHRRVVGRRKDDGLVLAASLAAAFAAFSAGRAGLVRADDSHEKIHARRWARRNAGRLEDDDESEEPLPASEPPQRKTGTRVFIWGRKACFPVSESSGDLRPQDNIRTPTEVAWFKQHADRHRCQWQQLSFGPEFGVARTDSGELFLWGSSRNGGKNGDNGIRYAEPRRLRVTDDVEEPAIADVQCSESAVWGLTSDGRVVVWQRVPEMLADAVSSSSARRNTPFRGQYVGNPEIAVKSISIGSKHAAFLTEGNGVHCLGDNQYGQCAADPSKRGSVGPGHRVRFPRHSDPVLQVHCGQAHTVAIGAEGQCLAWGDDSSIQLGLGDTRSNQGDDRPFTGSRGYINFLKTGQPMAMPDIIPDRTSYIIDDKGKVIQPEKYGEYQPHFQWRPSLMMEIPLEYARQVHGTPYPPPERMECGDNFTILTVRDSPDWYPPEEQSNRLFCCGENVMGQCGRSKQASQQMLAAVRLPKPSRTSQVSCGAAHCVAVLQRVGTGAYRRGPELWSWGANNYGQTGGGKQVMAVCPASGVKLPCSGVRPEGVWCGCNNSAVICSEVDKES